MPLDISKFLEQFFLEAADKLIRIQNFMVELEQNPRDAEALLGIQRDVHTIKGSARMVGLKEIAELAHRLEDVFAKLHGRGEVDAARMEALYAAVDGLSGMVAAARQKQAMPDAAVWLGQLQAVLEDRPAVLPAPPAGTAGEPALGRADLPPETGRQRFSLDFAALRRSFQTEPAEAKPKPARRGKPAARTVPPPPPAARPGEADRAPPPSPEPLPVEPPARAPLASPAADAAAPPVPGGREAVLHVPERQYLKVDGDKVETIINQVTDLLAKRYFFSSVLRTFRGLGQVADGFQREWLPFKSRLLGRDQEPEAVANIENMFDQLAKNVSEFERDFKSNLSQFEGALRDIYDGLLDIKLTPISTIFSVYPRYVRDYARRSGKKIRLFVRGGDSQLDKSIIEKISEPLIHMLRNACDHGIEEPDHRRQLGKDEVGTIIVEANKKGNHVEIRLQDDGAGLDRETILRTAVQRGLVGEKKAAALDDAEVYDFIFEPGFSTRLQVSDTSGRGIGMDIVKRAVNALNGTLSISTVRGRGTTITLEFPIAVFTTKVMFIVDEGRTYAVPSGLIREIVRLPAAALNQKHDFTTVVHRGEIYSVARLNQVWGGPGRIDPDREFFMVLPKVSDRRIGILVDGILHENEVIIKELGPFLGKCRFVFGVVIDDRGRLLTVIDLHDVVASPVFSHRQAAGSVSPAVRRPSRERRRVLVVDDSLLVREMEKNVLETAGYEVATAINGLDGYNKAISERFDLVLADIEMPEMDGFELIENLRQITDYAQVPVIVLSTREREQDKVRGIRVGANAWLQKQNFDDREFLRVVRSFIG